jgi:hypothetical protein
MLTGFVYCLKFIIPDALMFLELIRTNSSLPLIACTVDENNELQLLFKRTFHYYEATQVYEAAHELCFQVHIFDLT